MASVDLAFEGVASQAGAASVVYWRLWDQCEWLEPVGGSCQTQESAFLDFHTGITYENLRGRIDEFLDAPAVVFWGDFLHMAVYLRQNADVLGRRMGVFERPSDAMDFVAQHLLLKNQPADVLAKVMSYGTTLSFNTASDYSQDYGLDLEVFLRGIGRVWHRDGYSAQVAAQARFPRDEECQGLDAAFLLRRGDRERLEGTMGVFFGRSSLPPEMLAALGRSLAVGLGLRPEWVPWGGEPALWPLQQRRRFRYAWPGLEHREVTPGIGQKIITYRDVALGNRLQEEPVGIERLFDRIARHSFVLTDTYHLAVNSWRLGTPAVCVIDPPAASWNVNSGYPGSSRDKRIDLYSQLEALDLLVDASRLRASLARTVHGLADHLRDQGRLDVTHGRIEMRRQHSLSSATGWLRTRVGSDYPEEGS